MDRIEAEIGLLLAMYPDQVIWSNRGQELKYVSGGGATLIMRLPPTYPGDFPELILVRGYGKEDLRDEFRNTLQQQALPEDEEICDSIIQTFEDFLHAVPSRDGLNNSQNTVLPSACSGPQTCKVVICWLHHLLATSKRKLALNPTMDASSIRGLTKPGYPGILIFAGPAASVDAHISELKAQRWQAFQVRFEEGFRSNSSDMLWQFKHGGSIKEFESMAEVVQDLGNDAEQQKFLAAVGIK